MRGSRDDLSRARAHPGATRRPRTPPTVLVEEAEPIAEAQLRAFARTYVALLVERELTAPASAGELDVKPDGVTMRRGDATCARECGEHWTEGGDPQTAAAHSPRPL